MRAETCEEILTIWRCLNNAASALGPVTPALEVHCKHSEDIIEYTGQNCWNRRTSNDSIDGALVSMSLM